MTERITQYLNEHYGVCAKMESIGRCDCVAHKDKNQHMCEHYSPIIANSWDEMCDIARARYLANEQKHT